MSLGDYLDMRIVWQEYACLQCRGGCPDGDEWLQWY